MVVMSETICVRCRLPITDGVYVGMGDGYGQQFGHRSCYWRTEAERDAASLATAQARIAELEGALSQIIRVLGPAPCRCEGQQEEVAQALKIARTALAAVQIAPAGSEGVTG